MDEENCENSKDIEKNDENRSESYHSSDSEDANENTFTRKKKKVRCISDSDSEISRHNDDETEKRNNEDNDLLESKKQDRSNGSDSDSSQTSLATSQSSRTKSQQIDDKHASENDNLPNSENLYRSDDYDSDSSQNSQKSSRSGGKKSQQIKYVSANENDDLSNSENHNRSDGSDSDSDSSQTTKNVSQSDRKKSQRVENKHKAMSKKFDRLFKTKQSEVESEDDYSNVKSKLSAICDSDSSDVENINTDSHENIHNKLNNDPKPVKESKNRGTQRMSAKIAMEQMQKIKSESSRMLREKEISLPYHKPKQISLKDIMIKKNIQFVPGVKKPNLRMNEEQLKEYVLQLEKREKDILELYDSSSEDEENNENHDDINEAQKLDTNSETLNNFETDAKDSDHLPETSDIHMSDVYESDAKIDQNEASSDCNDIDHENKSGEKLEPNISLDIVLKESVSSSTELEESVPSNVEMKDPVNETTTNVSSMKNSLEIVDEMEITVTSNGVSKEPVDESRSVISPLNVSEIQNECTNNHLDYKTQLLGTLPSNPKLSGSDGGIIDFSLSSLDSNEELSGVNAFKKKFFLHSHIKTPEEIEREKNKKIIPGKALMNFRRELEDQIREQKLQEWKRKREEAQITKLENKSDGGLSDCEEILEKDDLKEVNNKNENPNNEKEESSNETETEIEDDEKEEDCLVISKMKKSKVKCDYIEDEAELDDSFEDDDEETDEESDTKYETINLLEKKKPSRIYNPFVDENSSDDDNSNPLKNVEKPCTKNTKDALCSEVLETDAKLKDSVDLFDTQEEQSESVLMNCSSDEYFALAQKYTSNESMPISKTNTLNDSESILSTNILSSNIMNLNNSFSLELSSHINQGRKSPLRKSTLNERSNQKNGQLFEEEESVSFTQEIAEMCSGKFSSQESDLPKIRSDNFTLSNDNSQSTQNMESELLELCTGKFVGINKPNTQLIESEEIDGISNDNKAESENSTVENSSNCTKKTETKKSNGIKSFLVSQPIVKDNPLCILNENETNEESQLNVSKSKYFILSSSSDDEKETCNQTSTKKNKSLKSKRERNTTRKIKPLESSDDDTDNEDSDEDDKNSDVSLSSIIVDEKQFDYDSEENEIEIIPEKVVSNKPKTKKSEFFEQEAELTTDDEWKGSGDEDEQGLDEFEWEEGDADQLDHRKVNKELERIHRHQMLDKDTREIKILQDILLEDGDLEGGTRERKFRWKNIDNSVESGAIVGEDNQDDFDDTQNEEQWRKQRYERETYLRELMKKEMEQESPTARIPSRLSIIKASLDQSHDQSEMNLLHKQNKNTVQEQKNLEDDKINKKSTLVPSPVKKPFMSLQNQYKKSFLSKGEAALNRLNLLTKNIVEARGDAINIGSLGSGKNKKIVFTTVSPQCNKDMVEDEKLKKRKAVADISTPTIIKKMKLTENCKPKSRKSLIDHLE